jgi:hypothetical protein
VRESIANHAASFASESFAFCQSIHILGQYKTLIMIWNVRKAPVKISSSITHFNLTERSINENGFSIVLFVAVPV